MDLTPSKNHFPENDNPFCQQRKVPMNNKYSDAVRKVNVNSRYKHGKMNQDEKS